MYAKINLAKLYEQSNTQAIDTDQTSIEQNSELEKTNTGALHAFPITSANINSINQLINGNIKEWKSDTPLSIIGSDGTIGGTSMLEGLPVYLMIRIANKAERASKEVQLRLTDRIYVLLDTSKEELRGWLTEADNKDDRIRVSVKTPVGKEHSVELWKENNVKESPESNNTNVTVDLNAQIENPGTAAGIEGVVTENKTNNKDMKNSKINEAMKIVYANTSNGDARVKKDMSGKPTPQQIAQVINDAYGGTIGDDREDWVELAFSVIKDKLTYDKVATALGKDPYTYVLSFMDESELNKSYLGTGKTIKFYYDNIKGVSSASKALSSNSNSNYTEHHSRANKANKDKVGPFADQAAGDAFRTWANSTPELAKKYGKTSQYDLDAKGKFNNSFIRKAYAAAKAEYDAHLASKDTTKKEDAAASKYKVGEIVYYKDDAVVNKEAVATIAKSEEKKAAESGKKKEVYDINKQYGTGANPRAFEGIATSFSTFKSITEQDTSKEKTKEEIDAEAGLIKDFNDGKIKKGVVVKEIDKDNIEVTNVKSDENENVKISNVLDKAKVKEAAAKAKAQSEEAAKTKEEAKDTRTSSQKAEDKLADEKAETKDLKGELKSKREEKRAAKKNVRKREKAERKTERQDKKQDRIKGRIDKQEKKIENIGESKVYTFADFIKSVNKLN